jgi:uncharacterized protein YndB with AHSA1/START domain
MMQIIKAVTLNTTHTRNQITAPLSPRGREAGRWAEREGATKAWKSPAAIVTLLTLSACSAPPTAIVAPLPIVESIVVKAKVADVWKAWTTKEGVVSFFAPDANIEAKVDGAFEVFMNPLGKPGEKGADGMRVLALEENAMLTFTWNAPPNMPIARAQRTVVTVRMAARGDSLTDVSLTHSGFGSSAQWLEAHAYFEKAWPSVMKNLKKRFDDGPVDWTPWLKRLQEKADAAATTTTTPPAKK